MSLIGDRLQTWLDYHKTTILRQEVTVCERFPPKTKEQMVDISMDSARWSGEFKPEKIRERGTPITQDYTLGKERIGTRWKVAIPRPPGTIGTYHTHPYENVSPSYYDILDAMVKDDKVICIGASGKPGTKIACFTPKGPKWSELQYKVRLLDDDIKGFNRKVFSKYKERGRELLYTLSIYEPKYYDEGIALENRKQALIDTIKMQLLYMGYEEKWRPQQHVDGWEAMPLMMDSCKIIWETFKKEEKELPYEL